jgi:6-phosphogluconolactonase
MKKLILILAACISLHAQSYSVFVGTYTGMKTNDSKGIYKFEFNAKTGAVTSPPELAGEAKNPSFLAIHPNKRFLYAVSETADYGGRKQGSVASFSMAPGTRKLTLLNEQPSGGDGPCHLSIDREGKNVLVANYGGGSVEVLPIDKDGSLKAPSAFIQHKGDKQPHGHSINLDQSGKYAIVADLGLDKVISYKFDSNAGTLTEAGFVAMKTGSGPRHFSFSPDFKRAYVINELSCTLTAFTYDGNGKLIETQSLSTLPEEKKPGYSTAEVVVHPSGKFVYGSNRGHDSIAVFSVDANGKLARVQNESTRGKTPRNFAVDPTGNFLIAANQGSDNIAFFKIDQATGKLTLTGDLLNVPKPVCIRFLAQ